VTLTTLDQKTARIVVDAQKGVVGPPDIRPEAHAYSRNRAFPTLGETGTSQEIIDLLRIRSA